MVDDLDEFEKETEELDKEEQNKKTLSKKKEQTKEPGATTERYVAFFTEPRLGIMDTLSGEVIVEGLSDIKMAELEAFKLNKLDKIAIASGAQ